MIRLLTGRLADIQADGVVIDVRGVGYFVRVKNLPATTKLNTDISLHTYLAVRENALDLYGFITRDELEVFELLLGLPKIGPKSAMQILGQADIELLKKAVLTNDASYLSKMSGIGKKTAEKIVSELADKFAERYDTAAALGGPVTQEASDVIDALITLGYPLSDARAAAQNIAPGTNTNQAIKDALKQLGTP